MELPKNWRKTSQTLINPFLCGDDPIFGTRFTGQLSDFFDTQKLHTLTPDPDADLNIIYGCGAALGDCASRFKYEFPLEKDPDWRLIHQPTHPEHFYDIHRFEFSTSVTAVTNGSCHIMNLVEGQSIILETANGMRQRFNYAETFIVPAAAGSYILTNHSNQPVKVVRAFVKPEAKEQGVSP